MSLSEEKTFFTAASPRDVTLFQCHQRAEATQPSGNPPARPSLEAVTWFEAHGTRVLFDNNRSSVPCLGWKLRVPCFDVVTIFFIRVLPFVTPAHYHFCPTLRCCGNRNLIEQSLRESSMNGTL